jgi:carbamoyl-phosphate synthase large subunit
MARYKKILVVGSGPIKIGEAAEFDYSGSQALRALKEEGISTILINSNVATVQTTHSSADKVYLLPVTSEFIRIVIERERPEAIMIGFGGQSALNAGIDLSKDGTLAKYNVDLLGTKIIDIEKALGRSDFSKLMKAVKISVPPSASARSEDEALSAAKKIGFPLMVRVSFNLGGRGSSIVEDAEGLKGILKKAFAQSRVGEVLVEKYLEGWKEIEYEVVRDSFGNCAVVACIENLDPMGIHTGDSVAVTPSQTLDDYDYQRMRSVAIQVAEAINLIGECNVQFALDPKSSNFYVIETNPRMSRSSALASKATGYPLAYVSAKLALGYKLYELKNEISKATTACFEPSLDYITIKMPRWDINKFEGAEERIGSEMKSIGEVMAIGRSLEEAMQKAARMLDIGESGIVGGTLYHSDLSKEEAISAIKERKPYWFRYVAKALKEGATTEEISRESGISQFFVDKIKGMVELYEHFLNKEISAPDAKHLLSLGFSPLQLNLTKEISVKEIDTLAAEWPASSSYLYTAGSGIEDDIRPKGLSKLLVLGSGVFRIGVSVEFDYSSVAIAEEAKKHFDEVILLNCNPETVSTDWNKVGRLYFDEITAETVSSICDKEQASDIAIFSAGQTGNNLAKAISQRKIRIYGSDSDSIAHAEDRKKFSELLEKLGIGQPEWTDATSSTSIKRFIDEIGFPVLVRPSFILSGAAMKVANNMHELEEYLREAAIVSREHPVVISRFLKGCIEAELDCASDGKSILGVMLQHIEETGVHSGDSTIFTPANLENIIRYRMNEIALELARTLKIKGLFNIQFAIENGEPKVIELNLRASRSMPFSSKSLGINLVESAIKGINGKFEWDGFKEPEHRSIAVKSPQFSWSQLKGAYPHLSPEMKSTGESAALGRNFNDALLKSWLGVTGNKIPKKGILIYGRENRTELLRSTESLSGFTMLYTLESNPIPGCEQLTEAKAMNMLAGNEIDLVIGDGYMPDNDKKLRRLAVDLNIPLVLNGRLAERLSNAFVNSSISFDELREYW